MLSQSPYANSENCAMPARGSRHPGHARETGASTRQAITGLGIWNRILNRLLQKQLQCSPMSSSQLCNLRNACTRIKNPCTIVRRTLQHSSHGSSKQQQAAGQGRGKLAFRTEYCTRIYNIIKVSFLGCRTFASYLVLKCAVRHRTAFVFHNESLCCVKRWPCW